MRPPSSSSSFASVNKWLVCVLVLFVCPFLSPFVLSQQVPSTVLVSYDTPYPTLQDPSSLVVTPAGILFIADRANNRVLRMLLNGTLDYIYRSQTPTLWYSSGIDVDSVGSLYVATTSNSVVYKVDPNNTVLATYNATITNPALRSPQGVAVDCSGVTYICDSTNTRIVRVDPNSNYSSTVLYSTGGAPRDVALTSTGQLIVALYTGQILKLSPLGELLMVWNTSNPTMSRVQGVGVDSNDNVLVADTGNNRVVAFNATSNTVIAIYTTANPGLAEPIDVAVDAQGIVYIADSDNNRVIAIQGLSTRATNAGDAGIVRCPAPRNGAGSHISTGHMTALFLGLALACLLTVAHE